MAADKSSNSKAGDEAIMDAFAKAPNNNPALQARARSWGKRKNAAGSQRGNQRP